MIGPGYHIAAEQVNLLSAEEIHEIQWNPQLEWKVTPSSHGIGHSACLRSGAMVLRVGNVIKAVARPLKEVSRREE